MDIPKVTIYVRHSVDCKHKADEMSRRCNCRKHLRWFKGGKLYTFAAKTRSWSEAEKAKTSLEDQLSGKTPPPSAVRDIRSAITLFIEKKEVEELSPDLIAKYKLWLGRLATYAETKGVFAVQGFTDELIIGFCATWKEQYPSSNTRNKLRERYRTFMKFCHRAKWLDSLPEWPKMDATEVPTLPLTDEEYAGLLDAVYVVVRAPQNHTVENQSHEYWCARVHGLFQLMRWSGLSIMDALTLPKAELLKDNTGHRVVTARTKTGTNVSVLLPPAVAEELLHIPNDNPKYFFWSGVGSPKSICGNWGKRFIVPCFEEAKIKSVGNMRSHRLRDTFACDLLQKGVSLEDVSKLLGHKSIRVTEKHYAAWVPGRQSRLDAEVMKTWDTPKKAQRPGRKLSLVKSA